MKILKPVKWLVLFWYWGILTRALVSSQPADMIGGPEKISRFFDPSQTLPSFLLHLVSYAVLATLIVWVVEEVHQRALSRWLSIAMIHGVLFEYVQYLVPKRWPYWLDAFANCLGVFLIMRYCHYRYRRSLLSTPVLEGKEPIPKTGTHG